VRSPRGCQPLLAEAMRVPIPLPAPIVLPLIPPVRPNEPRCRGCRRCRTKATPVPLMPPVARPQPSHPQRPPVPAAWYLYAPVALPTPPSPPVPAPIWAFLPVAWYLTLAEFLLALQTVPAYPTAFLLMEADISIRFAKQAQYQGSAWRLGQKQALKNYQ